MPFGVGTMVLNRHQTKIVRIPFDCGDAANAVAYTFVGCGGSPCYRPPRFAKITRVTGPNSESEFQIEAMDVNGFTIRKLTAGGAGVATLIVKFY